jgi:hypothetical protein
VIVGYARVSTQDQNLSAQLDAQESRSHRDPDDDQPDLVKQSAALKELWRQTSSLSIASAPPPGTEVQTGSAAWPSSSRYPSTAAG